jgi:hypothetical protein
MGFKRLLEVAGAAGLEPVTSAVTGQRSNQLSYAPARTQTVRKPIFEVKPKLGINQKCLK